MLTPYHNYSAGSLDLQILSECIPNEAELMYQDDEIMNTVQTTPFSLKNHKKAKVS